MALLLYSLIRRHMKAGGRYFEAGKGAGPPVVPGMAPGESLIGWYQNPEPWESCRIVFSDKAIYSVDNGEVVRLALDDIVGYEFPKSKTDVTGVRVRTRQGFRFLRVAGSFGPYGKFKDAFSIIQVFFAIADQNRHPEPPEDTTPRVCPHCHTLGTRFRIIFDALVCPACSRSFKP
jgi:hypothetical protein